MEERERQSEKRKRKRKNKVEMRKEGMRGIKIRFNVSLETIGKLTSEKLNLTYISNVITCLNRKSFIQNIQMKNNYVYKGTREHM